ncbi:hypothetical protein [Nannocystis pusilla]|uniref:hypothetical protein n=1 Tax=Nannocystis pusilla TaxID=889268 RepID=UPI003B7C5740
MSDATTPGEHASKEPVAGPDAPAPASADAAKRPDAAAPTPAEAPATPAKVPPAQLLGRKQAEIEAQLGPLQFADGWARLADGALALQFRGGRCVGLRGHVLEDMDCSAVATWLGFDAATFPCAGPTAASGRGSASNTASPTVWPAATSPPPASTRSACSDDCEEVERATRTSCRAWMISFKRMS